MIGYSPGHMAMQREFGLLVCPHCREVVTKTHPNQIACSKRTCKLARDRKAAQKRRTRAA